MSNNRSDGFGEVAPAPECGPNGRKPNEGFQMRNTTFISSMVLSVACVSAANAAVTPPGFVSIDDFGIADAISPSAPTASGGYNYSAGSDGYTGQATSTPYGAATSRDLIAGWKTFTVAGYAKGSTSVGTNAMTMSYGGSANNSGRWYNSASVNADPLSFATQPYAPTYYSNQTSTAVWGAFSTDTYSAFGGSINMSGLTAFSFDLSGFTTTGSSNTAKMYLRVLSFASNGDSVLGNYDVALSNGHVEVAAANFGAQDWSAIYQIEMVFTNTTLVSNVVQAAPTGTVTVSNFGYVPAPGAIALLGAAGLIGARRRRD